ncbi:MAG: heme ABC exporter ATP-binding protein CcmA [Proteobacteria bacterium]|nr:heme ABC exporter ATP-binding protein CcmA [Pseudomonadota bacterium]
MLDTSSNNQNEFASASGEAVLLLQSVDLVCQRDHRDLFEPLNLVVNPGDCIELLGPNGSGKSTLLRTLAGLHSQYQGEFDSAAAVYQGHRLGLDELLSPLENLAWFAGLQDQVLDIKEALQVIARLGLLEQAHTACQRLSAGQQRRAAIARWLLAPHKLWLLDEPFNALDAQSQQLLNELLTEHCRRGGAVICATHLILQVAHKTTVQLRQYTGASA